MPESNVAATIETNTRLLLSLMDILNDHGIDVPNYSDFYSASDELFNLARKFREGMEGSAAYEQIAQEAHAGAQEAHRLVQQAPDPGAPQPAAGAGPLARGAISFDPETRRWGMQTVTQGLSTSSSPVTTHLTGVDRETAEARFARERDHWLSMAQEIIQGDLPMPLAETSIEAEAEAEQAAELPGEVVDVHQEWERINAEMNDVPNPFPPLRQPIDPDATEF